MDKHIYSAPHGSTEAMYITVKQECNKRHIFTIIQRKHKQRTNADLQPNMTCTRQHLKQYYFTDWHHPQTFPQKPPKKGSHDFPERVVQPWRPQPRVPPAWFTELVPRVAHVVRPTARTGFFGGTGPGSAAISVRTGWGMAGAPYRDCTD